MKIFIVGLFFVLFSTTPCFSSEIVIEKTESSPGIVVLKACITEPGFKPMEIASLTYSKCEIRRLFTKSGFRNKGYATQLMSFALEGEDLKKCEAIRLLALPLASETIMGRLLDFYSKFGFEIEKIEQFGLGRSLIRYGEAAVSDDREIRLREDDYESEEDPFLYF